MTKSNVVDCDHDWSPICAVHSKRFNKDGMGMRCSKCEAIGFQNVVLKKEIGKIFQVSYVGNPTVVPGKELFQMEYDNTGRPIEDWAAHL